MEDNSNFSIHSQQEQCNKKKKDESEVSSDKDINCSYTAMIAQSIMRTPFKRATLSEIYNFMSSSFSILKKRGNGWRNCVRHTLSLNECFVKLNRPENGRSCNWTVHPSYFDAFMRGDYRKRRTSRKKSRNVVPQWSVMQDERYMGFQPPNPVDMLSYLPPSNQSSILTPHHTATQNFRANEIMERINQETPPPTIAPTSHSMWHSYVSSLEDTPPSKPSNAHDSCGGYPAYHHNMYEQIQHKHLPPTTNPSNQPYFQLPEYTNGSPPSEINEHLSLNNLDSSTHAERYTRYNRQYINSTFHQGYSKTGSPNASDRPAYELNCGGERVGYERTNSCGTNNSISQPIQIENSCYAGNITNRTYRTEYF